MGVYRDISFQEVFSVIIKKWWIIISVTSITCVIGLYFTIFHVVPVYESSSTLFVGREGEIDVNNLKIHNQLIIDYQELIQTRLVVQSAIDELELEKKPSEIINNVSISTTTDSRFLYIWYSDEDPKLAANITNYLAEALVEKSTEAIGVKKVDIIDKALIPTSPVSPNLIANLMMSGMLGIMISLIAIFVLYVKNKTISGLDELKRIFNAPILGEVKTTKSIKQIEAIHNPIGSSSEGYRKIRTYLENYTLDCNKRMIVVTSPKSEKGIGIVTANLGVVLAQCDYKVLLIDCDLHNPSLHLAFGIGNKKGLSNIIVNGTDIKSATKSVEMVSNLDIITAGFLPKVPADKLNNKAMRLLLQDLKTKYDYIFLKAPPVLSVADTMILASKVDGIVLLTPLGHIKRQDIFSTLEILENIGTTLIGGIVTKKRVTKNKYFFK